MVVVDNPPAPVHNDLAAWERGLSVLLEEDTVGLTVVESLSLWPQYLASWDSSSVPQFEVAGMDMLRLELACGLVVGEAGTAKASDAASFAAGLAPPLVYASLPHFGSGSGKCRCAGLLPWGKLGEGLVIPVLAVSNCGTIRPWLCGSSRPPR